jgi:glycosyltransferase involved in cell wall biosynthesis
VKVVVYPSDRYACGHYRMVWPAEALAAQGMDVTVVMPGEETGIGGLKLDGRVHLLSAPDCDVAVFQRPARTLHADMIPLLRKKGVAVVVDMDDDLERIHPSNPAFRGMHPATSPDYNWANARRACRDATLVTVSTPALLPRYGDHGRARLIYNYVPGRYLGLSRDGRAASVGWAGSLHSHPGDLDEVAGTFARLQREGHELRFVGPPDGVGRKLGVELGEGAFTGDLELEDWIPAVSRLGVGAAPLADNAFNAAKSWLKPLEYSAAGVPWVASDIVEYRRLARLCGAPLARRPKEWYRELKRLLTDDGYRLTLSEMVREAAAGLTVEGHAHEWAEAWQEAMRFERACVR